MVRKKTEQRDAGFILLHRKSRSNGIIWDISDPRKFMWWCDILMECNHEDKKLAFGFISMTCKRGESLNSLQTWAKRWRVTVSTVRRFLGLLKNENMIEVFNEQKTTRITVCNYSSYNDTRQAKGTKEARNRIPRETQEDTNNTLNNTLNKEGSGEPPPHDENELPKDYRTWTKEQFLQSLAKYQQKYDRKLLLAFSGYWREPDPHGKMKFQLEKTWATGRRLGNWKRIEDEKKSSVTSNYKSPSPVGSVVTDEILKNRELLKSIEEQ